MPSERTRKLVAAFRDLICETKDITRRQLTEIAAKQGIKMNPDNKFTMHGVTSLALHLKVPLPPASSFGTSDFENRTLWRIPGDLTVRKRGINAAARRREQRTNAEVNGGPAEGNHAQNAHAPCLRTQIRQLEYDLEERDRGRRAEAKAMSDRLLHAQLMLEIVDRKVKKIMDRTPSTRRDKKYLITKNEMEELLASRVKRHNLRHWSFENVWHESILPWANVKRISRQKIRRHVDRRECTDDSTGSFRYNQGCVCGIMGPSDEVMQEEIEAIWAEEEQDDPDSDPNAPAPFVWASKKKKRSLDPSPWFKARCLELYLNGAFSDDEDSLLRDADSDFSDALSEGLASDRPSRHPDESDGELPVACAATVGAVGRDQNAPSPTPSPSPSPMPSLSPSPIPAGQTSVSPNEVPRRTAEELEDLLMAPSSDEDVADANEEMSAANEGSLRYARARERAVARHRAYGS